MKETYLSRDFRETAAQRFPAQAKQLNAASAPFAFGKTGKFCRREYSFDTPGFQVNDPIGKPIQIGQSVFGNQHSMVSLFNDFENLTQLPHCLTIQICRRFIENINLRIHGIYRSESKQLLLSAGHGENASVRQCFNFQIGYGFRYSFVHGIPVCADILQPKGNLGRGIRPFTRRVSVVLPQPTCRRMGSFASAYWNSNSKSIIANSFLNLIPAEEELLSSDGSSSFSASIQEVIKS